MIEVTFRLSGYEGGIGRERLEDRASEVLLCKESTLRTPGGAVSLWFEID